MTSNFQKRLLFFQQPHKEEKKEKVAPKKIKKIDKAIITRMSKGADSIHKDTTEKKKIKKINCQTFVNKMKEEEISKHVVKKENENEIIFNIRNRSNTVSGILSDIQKRQIEIKKKEEEKKLMEEERARIHEQRRKREEERRKRELEERRKREEEERIRREEEEKIKEEERKQREEEERIREEERKKREEEERKIREEEEKIKEEERKIKEEEERIKKEEEKKVMEEEERKREEERRKRIEERKMWIKNAIKKNEEEKNKMEEEKIRKEAEREKREEERKKREEERKKKQEEEEKMRKDEEERMLEEIKIYLELEIKKKYNKNKEDYTEEELDKLMNGLRFEKYIEKYNNTKFKKYYKDHEGRDIKFTFEEKNQISTESLSNLQISESGKIITLNDKSTSKITIYSEVDYEEEDCIVLESKVNSIKVGDNKIYCALNEKMDNILIIPLDDHDNKTYLNGHDNYVSDIALTKYGYIVSSDIEGKIIVWSNNKVKKLLNDFFERINTVTEVNDDQQRVAILSFSAKCIKFYDLRYSDIESMATISNILGSGFCDNMLKLNQNILAVAGTYIYIIDLNSLEVVNQINCLYANDCISNFNFNDKGFFFVGQAVTNSWFNELEKGTLGYYQYNFNDEVIPEKNTLVKLASSSKCHDSFIHSIKQIDHETIVTGSFDGKIKFWSLKEI